MDPPVLCLRAGGQAKLRPKEYRLNDENHKRGGGGGGGGGGKSIHFLKDLFNINSEINISRPNLATHNIRHQRLLLHDTCSERSTHLNECFLLS